MKLTLVRDILTPSWTLGKLWADGKFFGYTVEDTDRLHRGESKVKTRTAIPAGGYVVQMTWSPKYGRLVPQLLAVPGFQGIRIHSGNDADDTEGCILPGLQRDVKRGRVLFSRDACRWLEAKLLHGGWIDIRYDLLEGLEAAP